MKSGLYACAGASATASAAAWAKRLDDPMTNRSNVYFGLSSTSVVSRAVGEGAAGGWVFSGGLVSLCAAIGRGCTRSPTVNRTTADDALVSVAARLTRS